MGFREMPFDEQECEVIVQSLTYDDHELTFDEGDSGVLYSADQSTESSNDLRTLNWIIATATTHVKEGSGSADGYEQLKHTFTFHRRHNYYTQEIFIPAFLFILISYTGFWIDRHVAPARVAISVIPVLIMRTLLNSVYASTQSLPYLNTLTSYLTTLQYLGCLTVFEYGAVQYFLESEKRAFLRFDELRKLRDLLPTVAPRRDVENDEEPPQLEEGKGPNKVVLPSLAPSHLMRRPKGKKTAPCDEQTYERLLDADGKGSPAARKAVEMLHASFTAADLDCDGTVDVAEFAVELRSFGIFEAPKAVRLALSNFRFHHALPDDVERITFDHFVSFLLNYQDHRMANIFQPRPSVFFIRSHPTSLQLDLVCRVWFLPLTLALVAVAQYFNVGVK